MLVEEVGLDTAQLDACDRGSVADRYLVAFELAMGVLVDRALLASAGERDWVLRVRCALRTLLEGLSGCPQLARACVVVADRDDARASRDAVLERLSELVWHGADAARGRLLADEMLDVIGETVRHGSAAALPGLLVQLHWWAVALRTIDGALG